MKRKISIGLILLLCVSMILSVTACKGTNKAKSSGPVTFVYCLPNDPTTDSGKFDLQTIKNFEAQYGKEVKIDLQTDPDIVNMMSKVKTMIAANNMPDLVALDGLDVVSVAAQANDIIDLNPYLKADKQLASWISQEDITGNTKNGKLLSICQTLEQIGIWYNKDMFAKAGIKPATTWDEFWSNCDKLKAAGYYPMSMDTKGLAWCTNLLLGAIIGSSDDTGYKFMHTFHPDNYNFPEFIDAEKYIQKSFEDYAPKNSNGADYNTALNNFVNGKTAIFYNGSWTIADFKDPTKSPKGFIDKVATSTFPDTSYVCTSTNFIVGNTTKAKEDAAMKFVKYCFSPDVSLASTIATGSVPDNPTVKFTAEVTQKQPLLIPFIQQMNAAKYKLRDYQSQWYDNVSDEIMTLYPELATGQMTPTQLAQKLTDTAKSNED